MSKKRNPLLFLTDIAEAIAKIESYTQSGKQNFFENETIQDATLFRLQTIGEAVNQLPEELKERYPDIRWKDIVGFRNILAHRYWRVDLNLVWGLFEPNGDIEQLKAVVIELIKELSS
jgi:uncharacterized protein with HEPN domain